MALRRRRWLLVIGVAVVVVGAAVAWLAVRGLAARSHLDKARAELAVVRSDLSRGDTAAALAHLRVVHDEAGRAHDLTHDPVWFVAEHVPVLGTPLLTSQGIADAVDDVTGHGLATLTSVADDLKPSRLRSGPDTVDVSLLAGAAAPLRSAADDLAHAQARVEDLKPSWLGTVSRARTELLSELTPIARSARQAARAATVAPPMLGADGPRRYFFGFQNTAEARGTGGLLGAFAIVTADHGRISVDRTGSDADLPPITTPPRDLPADLVRRYRPYGSDTLWVNTNIDPHFPDVAATWAALWQHTTGQRIDGAVALDSTAMADILRATGPVDVPGLGSVPAERVAPLVGAEQYRLFASTPKRKAVLVRLARAVIDAALSGRGDARTLLDGLGSGAAGGHVYVASGRPTEEAVLEAAGVAGAIPRTGGPYLQAVVSNASGTKLDWYADQSVDYRVDSCTGDRRTATITVRLTNNAPPSGLPPYVEVGTVGPVDRKVPNTNRVYLQVFTSRGSVLRSATVKGKPVATVSAPGLTPKQPELSGSGATLGADAQQGHVVYWTFVTLAPGETGTVVLHLDEPPSTAAPLLIRQNTARPWKAVVDTEACR